MMLHVVSTNTPGVVISDITSSQHEVYNKFFLIIVITMCTLKSSIYRGSNQLTAVFKTIGAHEIATNRLFA